MPERDYGIADLILKGGQAQAGTLRSLGDIQAQGYQQQGARAMQLGGSLASIAQSIPQQFQQQKMQLLDTTLKTQQVAQNNTIEQERVNKIADQDQLNALIQANPDPMQLREAIRQHAPEYLSKYDESMATVGEKAASTKASIAKAQESQSIAAKNLDEHLAGLGAQIHAHGDSPLALFAAAASFKKDFPDLASQADDLLKQAATPGGPDVKTIADGLIARSPQVMNATREAQTAATVAPSITPNAAGLTPNQQAEADARAAILKQQQTAGAATQANEQKRIGLEQQRVGIEQGRAGLAKQTFDLTYGTAPSEPGQTTVPIDPIAKSIAEYGTAPVSPRSMASGPGQALMKRVLAINPAYDASLYANRAPTRKAFTTGTQGQQINAINTAIGHMDQLGSVLASLDNSDVQIKNRAYNWLKSQFGDASVTNFNTLKDALSSEVAGVLAKGGATVSGIADAQSHINSAQSPAQLAGYIKTQIPIFGSKLNELNYQYHQQMDNGPDKKDPYEALSPTSKAILLKNGFDPSNPTVKVPGAGGGPGPAGGITGGSVRMTAPDGKSYDVPADKVEAAKAKGWK